MSKHLELDIDDAWFVFSRKEAQIAEEVSLDGIYSAHERRCHAVSAADVVRSYKELSKVERAFWTMKFAAFKRSQTGKQGYMRAEKAWHVSDHCVTPQVAFARSFVLSTGGTTDLNARWRRVIEAVGAVFDIRFATSVAIRG